MTENSRPHPKADLRGLVLAGGASSRMGQDKGSLSYHDDRPQVQVAYAMLESVCGIAVVSVSRDLRSGTAYEGLPMIGDTGTSSGPAAGLLAAWERHPDVAWLVLAVDLPLVTASDLEELVAERDAASMATAFRHGDGTLEPLCTIWEPAAATLLADEVRNAAGSLRHVLEIAGVHTLVPAHPEHLVSANSPQESEAIRLRLLQQGDSTLQ